MNQNLNLYIMQAVQQSMDFSGTSCTMSLQKQKMLVGLAGMPILMTY